jgi:minor histocompatibility antigen H13
MMGLALRYDLYLHYLSKQIPNGKTPLKAPYVDATGRWGERFWTSGAKGYETTADGARFKKVYFKASLVGYVIGMLATLIALNVYQHAQPALLYLVPGVLISLWGTALVRGELSLMWAYTEDDSLDQTRKGNGGTIEGNKDMNRQTDTKSAVAPADSKGVVEESQKEKSNEPQHVFLFSLTAPRQGLKEAKLFKKA